MYFKKGMSIKTLRKKIFFVGILKVTDEKSRIRFGSLVKGSGSLPKCHGSETLHMTVQGGSDISGTLSKLHYGSKKSSFL
jgi:hypothetical protein